MLCTLTMGTFLPSTELLSTLSCGAKSNEARLKLLEKRLVGQDCIEGDARNAQLLLETHSVSQPWLSPESAQLQPGTHAPRQPLRPGQQIHSAERAAKRKRGSSPIEQRPLIAGPSPGSAQQENPARGDGQQVNLTASTPARALFGSSAANTAGGSSAKQGSRTVSKTLAGGNRGSGGAVTAPAAGKPVAAGQTTLNAYYPVLDGSSRDSDASHGAGGQNQTVARNASGSPFQLGQSDNLRANASLLNRQQQQQQGSVTEQPGNLTPSRSRAAPGPALAMVSSLRHAISAPLAAIPEAGTPSDSAKLEEALSQARYLAEQLTTKDRQLAEMQQQLRQQASSAQQQVSALSMELSLAQTRAQELTTELQRMHQVAEERDARVRGELERIVGRAAQDQHALVKLQLASSSLRLGNIAVQRNGLALQEVWEDGQAAAALAARQQALANQREDLDSARRALRKRLQPPPRMGAGATPSTCSADGTPYVEGKEWVNFEEIYKARLTALKREEDALKDEMDRLAQEKARFVRMIKRHREEEGSRFACGTTLANRFVLISMLGKGGFSEVFKAYDLRDLRIVAAKVHQLNPGWSESRKASYVKHAIREVDIQKALRHPHIVSLVDIVEVDANCFATVLEFCDGGDLDALLRDHQSLPEKEAKSIVSQVMSGLNYLNQPGRRIIHYDLKPANILFDSMGAAKITDFGLSKVVEDGATQGMELTSQGAGTYWYLPPECFEIGGAQAPMITNKVDVWSVGVIFYQMLYGKRPYGEGLSQEQIMRDQVVLGAREVEFPSKPTVSAEGKDFIRKCLALRAVNRWDVATAAADPYLSLSGGSKNSRSNAAASSSSGAGAQ